MATVLRTVGPARPQVAAGDPAQRRQGAIFLSYERAPPPAAWTDNRLAQSQHFTGSIYLALNAVLEAMSSAVAVCERRKRRDRTTFGSGAVSVVKAVDPHGGAGNDEDYAPVHDHPIAEILHRPNPHDSFGSLLGYMMLQWGLTGCGPLWLVPGLEHGRPVELYPLVEALMQPAYAPSLQYPEGAWRVTPYYPTGTGWTYGTLGSRMLSSTLLPGTEVRKVFSPHPLLRNDGYSPLTACGIQLDVMEAIDLSRHSAFMQGSQLGTVVYVPGLSEDANATVAAGFRERYSGPQNARKVGVVSSPPGSTGEFKIEQMGESPREMDYQGSWEQAVNFVHAVFGVPPAVSGLKAVSGYAEFYAGQVQLHYRLCQRTKVFGDFFTLHLARPWEKRPGDYRVKVRVPKPRNDDEYVRNMFALGAQGACTVNEQRAAVDLKPIRFGELPSALYLKKVEQLEFPQPVGPDPNVPDDTNALTDAESPAEDPLTALLATGDTPTGGAPARPETPGAKGSLPPRGSIPKAIPAAAKPVADVLRGFGAEDLDGLCVHYHPDGPRFWIDQLDWHDGKAGKAVIAAAEKATRSKASERIRKLPLADLPRVCVCNEGPRPPGDGWVDLIELARPEVFKARRQHKFSSTHVELPEPLASRIRMLAATIPDTDLGDDGREDDPHVTVRYGLHTDDAADVAPLVAGGPVAIRLGAVSVFRGVDSGKDYDVIKVDVESDGLHRLNAALTDLPHTDTHPEYHPHATIAYVRAGLGDGYAERMGRLDLDATAGRIVFSDHFRRKTRLPLSDLPTAAVDLDATLARYDGWQGHEHFGAPLDGAREFLAQLAATHRVLIFTTRTKADDPALGRDGASADELANLVRDWMAEHDLFFDDVYTGQGKPVAEVYVDDRAVSVPPNPGPGEYASALEAIRRRGMVKAVEFAPTPYARALATGGQS